MTTATVITKERTPQQLLEDFVIGNADLERLELLLRKFNLFDALKLVWHEVRHSDFLAYLLNPQQNHGLADRFLKAFLQAVLRGRNSGVNPVHIDIWNLGSAEVHREWHNVDIFIRDEANRLAVLIENKVQSTEHSNQLQRYFDIVSAECAGWEIVPIYLTVERQAPSDERFIAVGYDQICEVLERLLETSRGLLNPDVRMMIEHYAEMLRRHLMSESEIAELCRRIYGRHREALDLIFEYRPDRPQLTRELLESFIGANPELQLDHCSKGYVRFIPNSMDLQLLRHGSGWTRSGRMLMFEMENWEDHVTVKLILGPGSQELRRKIFDFAAAKRPPFRPMAKLGAQWNNIFTYQLLAPKAYELHDDDFKKELERQWKRFLDNEVRAIISAFGTGEWLVEPPAVTD